MISRIEEIILLSIWRVMAYWFHILIAELVVETQACCID